MKDSFIFRDYQRGDEYEILTLYKQVNEREMTSAHWKWKFEENPSGKSVIKLMFDDKKLIGFYAVIPTNVQVGRNLVKAALSVNTMTHPDYRGQGIFAYLGKEAYQVCEQKGVKFVYGFPNNNIYQSRIKKLEWKGFGKMSVLQRDLKIRGDVVSRAKNIHEIDKFDVRVNSLWGKVRANYCVIVPRTMDFLNWRFVQHPTTEYSKYIFADKVNDVVGYVVLKIYARGDEIQGHIIDMLCIDEKDVVESLLGFSYDYFIKRGIRSLSCWMPDVSFYAQVLKEGGFTRGEFETYFGVKTLDKEDRLLRNVEQLDNWHLTMCDSDVF
ncbi:GNAT family N-acetyltransferase [Chloroflexota bacterium]